MSYEDELSQSQLKNLKRKVVSYIWTMTPEKAIQLALIIGIKIPKNLIDKFTSSD